MWNVEGRFGAVVCLTLGTFLLGGNQLAAQEQPPSTLSQFAASSDAAIAPAQAQPQWTKRPSFLIPLYVSFGVFQALDLRSTQLALAGGGREANPIMGSIVGSRLAATTVKIGTTAGIIFLNEKLWRRNRVASVVMMVTLNSAYAMVVSHNYSLAR